MKLIQLPVDAFLQEVASNSSAPGGGSVAALSSSLGSALGLMIRELTVNKKKFKSLERSDQEAFLSAVNILEEAHHAIKTFIDEDTLAFNTIMTALSLPKDTEEAVSLREKAIYEATLYAIDVPKHVIETSLVALRQLSVVLQYGNKNTVSDVGVATLMLHAGIEGAILNVKINAAGLRKNEANHHYEACEAALAEATALKTNLMFQIHQSLALNP